MVAALQCNLTRVASLQWGNSNDQCTYSWLGVNTLGHDMAHNNNNCDPNGSQEAQGLPLVLGAGRVPARQAERDPRGRRHHARQHASCCGPRSSATPNGHAANKLMWLLMGNAGGYFRQGRVINCGGKSINDVHTSLCNAIGLTDQTFGNPAYCDGPLAAC